MNKVNLELKHYCSDFKKVRSILQKLGAQKFVVKHQKDYFFNLPESENKSGRLKLRVEGDIQYLIYYTRPDFIKGKGVASDIKIYQVMDRSLLPFLQHAFGVCSVVEKRREVWKILNTVFHLDKVKNVGNIFEIELQKGRIITDKDRKIFETYQRALLPVLGPVIKGSNVDLVKR